jgi:hypothetical protein
MDHSIEIEEENEDKIKALHNGAKDKNKAKINCISYTLSVRDDLTEQDVGVSLYVM